MTAKATVAKREYRCVARATSSPRRPAWASSASNPPIHTAAATMCRISESVAMS